MPSLASIRCATSPIRSDSSPGRQGCFDREVF
jgi:hypothetical protein